MMLRARAAAAAARVGRAGAGRGAGRREGWNQSGRSACRSAAGAPGCCVPVISLWAAEPAVPR